MPVDRDVVSIRPDAAKAILGREVRHYAHLIRAGLPGQGRKRATILHLAALCGDEQRTTSCLEQLESGKTQRAYGFGASPGR